MSRNAPGPTFVRSRSVAWLKHGHPAPLSIGCRLSTAIGAAQRAFSGMPARAVAWARTFTDVKPKRRVKNAGAAFRACTVIVWVGAPGALTATSLAATPPPFASPYCVASETAVPFASPWAPASAAASAVPCNLRSCQYQEPTSTTLPVRAIRAVRKTTETTRAWPRSSRSTRTRTNITHLLRRRSAGGRPPLRMHVYRAAGGRAPSLRGVSGARSCVRTRSGSLARPALHPRAGGRGVDMEQTHPQQAEPASTNGAAPVVMAHEVTRRYGEGDAAVDALRG